MNINKITYDGLDALEVLTSQLRLVVITSLGPRIAFLGFRDGENLLYWKNDSLGRGDWRLLGGHRVWLTRPGADESEDTYASDNDPCEFQVSKNFVRVTGATHPVFKTQKGLEIRTVSDTSLEVKSFLVNQSDMLYSAGVWAPTCIDPSGGKEFGILLTNKGLTWDIVRIIIPIRYAGHISRLNDPQFSFTEDMMVIKPEGIESKRMALSSHGIIAMSAPELGLSFIKKTNYQSNGNYPLDCNLAIFIGVDNFMVEMETYGEIQTILPGEKVEHIETWLLVNDALDWNNSEKIIQLVK